MSLELLYWLLLLLWAVLGAFPFFKTGDGRNWTGMGGALLPWLCALVIGWAVFGQPIDG